MTTITITIERSEFGTPAIVVSACVVDEGDMRYQAPPIVVPQEHAFIGTPAAVAALVPKFYPSIMRAVETALGREAPFNYPHQATLAGATT